MAAMKEATLDAIRQLYFGEHWPIDVIAEELRLSARAVRRALVINGGARRVHPPGPYHKESDS